MQYAGRGDHIIATKDILEDQHIAIEVPTFVISTS